ncbi:hypothetical protein RJ639_015761 [Escallonia herrerae]|uniref:Glucose/Sorbosone dehydrogenase domain-containing protein n=1 Tax=Escallonia herrerae TaxID=1293975 RepID=A0AA88VIB0_9ASTE|nr:hypothetical protein RJ639_015761 [Escallonia herrerae]
MFVMSVYAKISTLLTSISCPPQRCDPFSAELFKVDSVPRQVPVLCNSTVSANSLQTSQAKNDFCGQVWDTCVNASVRNSPFAASLQGQVGAPANSTYTKLTDIWQSKADFCNAFGGASVDESVCFTGEPVAINTTTQSFPSGMCLEKIGNGSYLDMAAHPDGSNRAFFANQQGKIWLATIPKEGSGGTLELDESSPFLDLTDQVHFDTEFGLMGIAFHPNFAQNGRLFASFNCDKAKWSGCTGRCSCNSDVNCDPSKLGTDNGAQPCQYQSVIAEYSANGTASQLSLAESAKPLEVRRIFTMGLPFTAHHGGQILFGPTDGYLYFMMGDGGGVGDPYNFSQNKKSLLGKVMRLDIDNIPSTKEITDLLAFMNFQAQKRLLTLDGYEEVNIITKDGNYGWRIYEGPNLYTPPQSPGGNTSQNSIKPTFPVMGYSHTDVNKNERSASITGGYFYRSMTDPCMHGSYLYGDLYAGAMWAGTETPPDSGNFTSNKISFSCAHDSPIKCGIVPGSSLPALGYIFSFGEDNSKDNFLLASSGVYRIVRPSRCNYTCSKENNTAVATPGPASSPSQASLLSNPLKSLVLLCSFMGLLLLSLV